TGSIDVRAPLKEPAMTDLAKLSQADLWTGYRHYNNAAMEHEDAGEWEAAAEMESRRQEIREEILRRPGHRGSPLRGKPSRPAAADPGRNSQEGGALSLATPGEPAMQNDRESARVRLARLRLAKRVTDILIREQQAEVRTLEPRPTGLDEWMRANERSTRR